MLSVLIPTYKYDVVQLVSVIHRELTNLKVSFEIICLEDGSNTQRNIQLLNFSHVFYERLPTNIGRSAIRNLLAHRASYNWLLFLDGDVIPANQKFIETYVANLNLGISIFCGGVLYKNRKDFVKFLRYKYGKKHEVVSLKKRINATNKYFFSSNFLVAKEVFKSIQFDEKLTQYGFEDLLFSLTLQQNNISIHHINNPVFHLGIEDNLLFIKKTKEAIENLAVLYNQQAVGKDDVGVLKWYFLCKSLRIHKLISRRTKYFEKKAIKSSSLLHFQLFRIGFLHQLFEQQT